MRTTVLSETEIDGPRSNLRSSIPPGVRRGKYPGRQIFRAEGHPVHSNFRLSGTPLRLGFAGDGRKFIISRTG